MKTLYIVPTPIGNLRDITLRAVDVLKSVDLIVAEDTRHSQSLLQHYEINKPMIALHERNERQVLTSVIAKLINGESIALISDAGTPLISDPGYPLIAEAQKQGIKIIPLPGACAAITALSASGLPTDRFLFAGFLPAKQAARGEKLSDLKNCNATIILYESPHRIVATLKDIEIVMGEERKIVLARELTKLHETIKTGSVKELVEFVNQDLNQRKGEIVLLLEASVDKPSENYPLESLLKVLMKDVPLKKAVEMATEITGLKKNFVYQTALALQQ